MLALPTRSLLKESKISIHLVQEPQIFAMAYDSAVLSLIEEFPSERFCKVAAAVAASWSRIWLLNYLHEAKLGTQPFEVSC